MVVLYKNERNTAGHLNLWHVMNFKDIHNEDAKNIKVHEASDQLLTGFSEFESS